MHCLLHPFKFHVLRPKRDKSILQKKLQLNQIDLGRRFLDITDTKLCLINTVNVHMLMIMSNVSCGSQMLYTVNINTIIYIWPIWSFAKLQGHTLYFQTSRSKDSPNSIKTLIQTLILIVNYSLILGQGCRKVLK